MDFTVISDNNVIKVEYLHFIYSKMTSPPSLPAPLILHITSSMDGVENRIHVYIPDLIWHINQRPGMGIVSKCWHLDKSSCPCTLSSSFSVSDCGGQTANLWLEQPQAMANTFQKYSVSSPTQQNTVLFLHRQCFPSQSGVTHQ